MGVCVYHSRRSPHEKHDVGLLFYASALRLLLKPRRMFCKQIPKIRLLMNALFLDLFADV